MPSIAAEKYPITERAARLLYPDEGHPRPNYLELMRQFTDAADAADADGDNEAATLWRDAALEAERNL